MGPDELLSDSAFGDLAQVAEVGTVLKVHVQAVTEAMVALAYECVLVHAERELRLATTRLKALDGHESDLLGESEGTERVLDLRLL